MADSRTMAPPPPPPELDSPDPAAWEAWGRGLSQTARAHWRTLALYGAVGMVAGGAAALLIQPSYQSSAVFQPAIGQPIQTELALNNPEFFGDLLVSDTVLKRVSRSTFPWHGTATVLTTIYRYDKLPAEQRTPATVRGLRHSIDTDVNPRTGVVRFTVSAPAPDLAKAMADTLLAALNEVSITLRRERGAIERRFWAERTRDARQTVDSIEQVLGSGRAARGGGLAKDRLERALELAQQVYIEMRMREAQVAAQEARSTSAVTVLRGPVEAGAPSHPRRSLALLGGLIIGLSLGLARAVLRS